MDDIHPISTKYDYPVVTSRLTNATVSRHNFKLPEGQTYEVMHATYFIPNRTEVTLTKLVNSKISHRLATYAVSVKEFQSKARGQNSKGAKVINLTL